MIFLVVSYSCIMLYCCLMFPSFPGVKEGVSLMTGEHQMRFCSFDLVVRFGLLFDLRV